MKWCKQRKKVSFIRTLFLTNMSSPPCHSVGTGSCESPFQETLWDLPSDSLHVHPLCISTPSQQLTFQPSKRSYTFFTRWSMSLSQHLLPRKSIPNLIFVREKKKKKKRSSSWKWYALLSFSVTLFHLSFSRDQTLPSLRIPVVNSLAPHIQFRFPLFLSLNYICFHIFWFSSTYRTLWSYFSFEILPFA